jgi:hypothetical protein
LWSFPSVLEIHSITSCFFYLCPAP